eukprot:3409301-Prymnesium_polylepis.1
MATLKGLFDCDPARRGTHMRPWFSLYLCVLAIGGHGAQCAPPLPPGASVSPTLPMCSPASGDVLSTQEHQFWVTIGLLARNLPN